MDSTLIAALDAASRGWPTFRLGYKQKIPLQGSNGFKDATTDPEIIKDWFKDVRWNIGLATGGQSGLVVVDIDIEHGGDESLHVLQGDNDLLPDTATVVTGSGYHLYYNAPAGVDIPPSAGKLGLGIDVRGTGGYVVYPPSTHPNGKRYEWINDVPVVDAPSWLIEMMIGPGDKHIKDIVRNTIITTGGGVVIPNGQRNHTATSIAGYFRRFGFSKDQILDQLKQLPFETPMPIQELEIISWSVSRYSKEHDFSGSEYDLAIESYGKEM